jgi:hypothetical protein
LLVRRNIQERFAVFDTNIDAVAATLKLLAKRTNQLSIRIENENARMPRFVNGPFVDHIQMVVRVDSHTVSRLPCKRFRQFGPMMVELKLVVAFTDQTLRGGSLGSEDCGRDDCASGCGLQKSATGLCGLIGHRRSSWREGEIVGLQLNASSGFIARSTDVQTTTLRLDWWYNLTRLIFVARVRHFGPADVFADIFIGL